MLACRKAYVLLQRSKALLMAWVLALPFAGPGELEPYELKFPDLANYFPEGIRLAVDHCRHHRSPAASAGCRPHRVGNAPPRDRYDVVILAIIDFDFRFQRPQQIAAEFARQGHRVFWISPTRFCPPPANLTRCSRCATTSGKSICAAASPTFIWATRSRMTYAPWPRRLIFSTATGPSPSTRSSCSSRSGAAWAAAPRYVRIQPPV